MDTHRALILANGDLGDAEVLRRRLAAFAADLVIAADGGARHAATLGLKVDLAVGDFDSLSPAELDDLEHAGVTLLRHPVAKEETDLELALHEARRAGATQVVVLGAVGGRLDMTLANVALLAHPALRAVSIQLWNGSETAFVLVPPGGSVPGEVGDQISLLPLGGEAGGVTTHDLGFPLDSETLSVGPARGVSNRVAGANPRVDLASGALLVVHAPSENPEQGGQHGS